MGGDVEMPALREGSAVSVRARIGGVCAVVGLAIAACAPTADQSANPTAPAAIAEAIDAERSDALPITSFYDTPADLSATRPGALLAQELGTGYALPVGVSAERILYHSRDAAGRSVATSAVVLIPDGDPPAGGWPVIAWAHGTSGVARTCAPSAMQDVYYGDEGLFPMVEAGYAVVATDYHGLGTEGPHQYSNRTAQVNDVIHSIPAARAAVPSLGRRWVADGHSQGGVASWGVDQAQHRIGDPDYLGSVSVAGAVQGEQFARSLAQRPGVGFYLAFMAAGIQASDPDFDPATMLSPAVMEHYREVTAEGCLLRAYATFADLAPGAGLRPGWDRVPQVRQFFADLTPPDEPLAKPLLVIAGGADQTVPIAGVKRAVARLCAAGQPVTFREYPGLDHDPTMVVSTEYQLRWIGRLFDGKSVASTC